MVWWILVSALGAWGLLCVLWVVFGWLLGDGREQLIVLCPEGSHPEQAAARYHWLRSLGLLRGRITLVCAGISPEELAILSKKYTDMEFYSREVFGSRQER